jgi:ribosome maturation factor RimP
VGCGPRFLFAGCAVARAEGREEVAVMTRDVTQSAQLEGALSPVLAARGLELVDVEVVGAALTVFVDREGGVGLDELGEATRDVSAVLDDLDPMPGRYTLSVSSPGLERRLRTPAQFSRAVGEKVTARVDAGTPEVRRVTGTLESADGDGFTLAGPDVPGGTMHIAYDRTERARTVFEWGPEPRRTKSERVKRP